MYLGTFISFFFKCFIAHLDLSAIQLVIPFFLLTSILVNCRVFFFYSILDSLSWPCSGERYFSEVMIIIVPLVVDGETPQALPAYWLHKELSNMSSSLEIDDLFKLRLFLFCLLVDNGDTPQVPVVRWLLSFTFVQYHFSTIIKHTFGRILG